jgi:hypothetical protein
MARPRDPIDDELLKLCPYCRGGNKPTFRTETREWVHSFHQPTHRGTRYVQTICLGDFLLKRRGEDG